MTFSSKRAYQLFLLPLYKKIKTAEGLYALQAKTESLRTEMTMIIPKESEREFFMLVPLVSLVQY